MSHTQRPEQRIGGILLTIQKMFPKFSMADMMRKVLWHRYRRQVMKIIYKRPRGRIPFEHMISVLSLTALVRVMLAYLDMDQTDGWYRRLDFMFRLFDRDHTYDQTMMIVLMSLLAFGLYMNYHLYHRFAYSPPVVDHHYEQVNLTNTQHTIECNRDMFGWSDSSRSPSNKDKDRFRWKRLKRMFHLLRRFFFSNDLVVKYRRPLPDYPTLTNTNRAKIFLVYYCCEMINTAVFILCAMLCFPGLGFLIPTAWHEMKAWRDLAQFPIDMVGITIMVCSLFNTAIVMMGLITIIIYAMTLEYRQINAHLDRMHRQARMHSRRTLSWRWPMRLRYFLRHHHRLVGYIYLVDGKWSSMLLASVLTNTFANSYIVSFLIYRKLTLAEFFMFSGIIVAQVFIACLTLLPAAFHSDHAHRAQRHFVRLQATIADVRLKLQWQRYFEKIKDKRKNEIAYRIGILGSLTIFTMFRFLFTYGESFLFCQNMFLKLR